MHCELSTGGSIAAPTAATYQFYILEWSPYVANLYFMHLGIQTESISNVRQN